MRGRTEPAKTINKREINLWNSAPEITQNSSGEEDGCKEKLMIIYAGYTLFSEAGLSSAFGAGEIPCMRAIISSTPAVN
jgi:hypothetical protein